MSSSDDFDPIQSDDEEKGPVKSNDLFQELLQQSLQTLEAKSKENKKPISISDDETKPTITSNTKSTNNSQNDELGWRKPRQHKDFFSLDTNKQTEEEEYESPPKKQKIESVSPSSTASKALLKKSSSTSKKSSTPSPISQKKSPKRTSKASNDSDDDKDEFWGMATPPKKEVKEEQWLQRGSAKKFRESLKGTKTMLDYFAPVKKSVEEQDDIPVSGADDEWNTVKSSPPSTPLESKFKEESDSFIDMKKKKLKEKNEEEFIPKKKSKNIVLVDKDKEDSDFFDSDFSTPPEKQQKRKPPSSSKKQKTPHSISDKTYETSTGSAKKSKLQSTPPPPLHSDEEVTPSKSKSKTVQSKKKKPQVLDVESDDSHSPIHHSPIHHSPKSHSKSAKTIKPKLSTPVSKEPPKTKQTTVQTHLKPSKEEEFDVVEVDQLANVKLKKTPSKPADEEKTDVDDSKPSYVLQFNGKGFERKMVSPPKKQGIITSFMPAQPDVDLTTESKKESTPVAKKAMKYRGFGVLVPKGFINAVETEHSWLKFKQHLDKYHQFAFGVLFRYDCTSFRNPKGEKKKGDEEFPRTAENTVGVGFLASKSSEAYFLPLTDDEWSVPLEDRWNTFEKFVENEKIDKICYNFQDCVKPLLQHNFFVKPKALHDPKIAAWIYEPELDCGYDFIELLCYFKIQDKSGSESNSAKFVGDLLLCFRLWNALEPLLAEAQLRDVFDKQEMKVVTILAKMELEGIGFDFKTLAKHKKQLQKRLNELQRKAENILGHSIQLSSPQKVAHALFDELKLAPETPMKAKKTWAKNKSPAAASSKHQSTGEKVLKELKEKHELPGIILEHRHVNKLLNTWFDNLDKKAVPSKVKGQIPRIHTTWCQTNTATGRLASVNPNLQNLPKMGFSLKLEEDDDSSSDPSCIINIREAFSSNEGYTYVIEMRILAHMSRYLSASVAIVDGHRDKYLLEFFSAGKDIHKLIASRWLNKDPDQVSDRERENAKRIVYGILYGMGAPSLSEILKVSLGEAATFIETFLGKFPGLQRFLEETVEYAKKQHHIKTLLNRRRLLRHINSNDKSLQRRSERQAVNSVIQGTAADVVKLAMIKVDELLSSNPVCAKTRLLLQIHDELFFEVDEEHLEDVIRTFTDAMESVIKLDVEIPVRVNVGTRWGTMKEYKVSKQNPNTNPNPNTSKSDTKSATDCKSDKNDFRQRVQLKDEEEEEDDLQAILADMENDIAAAEAKDSSDDEDDTENLLAITEA